MSRRMNLSGLQLCGYNRLHVKKANIFHLGFEKIHLLLTVEVCKTFVVSQLTYLSVHI